MNRRLLLLLGATLSALAFAGASPAVPDRVVVDDNLADCPNADTSSIEAGVEMADPGDTVFVCRGVYTEQVTIESDDSNIRVVGQDREETILDGQNLPAMEKGFHLIGTSHVLITRFTVQRFHDDIWLTNSDYNTIRKNETRLAFGHDGIVVTDNSDQNTVEHNLSHDNLDPTSCGISVGGGASFNVVRRNETLRNPNQGILLGGALLGAAGPGNRILHNHSHDNGLPFEGANRGVGIFNNAPQTVIADNLVEDNRAHGIVLTGGVSNGVVVEDNAVLRNGSTNDDDGIRLQNGAANNVVSHNFSSRNRHDGVHLTAATGMPGVSGNVVEDNRLVENGTPLVGNGCGVDVEGGSSNNVVRDNYIVGHARAGVRVRNAGSANVVTDNHIRDSGADGIRNESTPGTLIEDNHIRGGVGFGTILGQGIHVLNSAGINVVENESDRNMADGIFLENADSGIVEDNGADRNGRDGIRADLNSAGNTILDNELARNAEHDCHDDSVGGGTAGTANFWIDNEGETENRPGLCDDDHDEDD